MSTVSFNAAHNKVLYTLLRMFYLQNQNDTYISTVKDIIQDFPLNEAKVWVEDLITQIQALPILGQHQESKTDYVVQNLRIHLTQIETKLTNGLPVV